MKTLAQRQNQPRERASSSSARSYRSAPGPHRADSIPHLQRTIGNQILQRLLQINVQEREEGSSNTGSPRFKHDFSQIPIHSPATGAIQTKLAINKPGDEHEQEADRVSEQVMHMPEPQLLLRGRQRAGADPRSQTEQAGQDLGPLQPRSLQRDNPGRGAVPPIVHEVLASPAQPLGAATRAFMEPRFGHDFSRVEVHADSKAAASAQSVNALAYTVGRHIVFNREQYAPRTNAGLRLLAHELAHTIQQGVQTQEPALVQRIPQLPLGAYAVFNLRNKIQALVDKNVKDYLAYRDAISKSTPAERTFALRDHDLLFALKNTLDHLSFARCVELLGRKAPTFNELRKNSVVSEAISDAWKASDVGVRDLVTQPHEEGGWVFMNLIDGSLSVVRAKAEGTNFLRVEPAPDVENSVLVAVFHTHPTLGPTAKPSRHDKAEDARRGVPNLVAGNTGTKPDVFQIYLSGPAVRKHLASETRFPGRSGGIPP